jgi:hypothetical protein
MARIRTIKPQHTQDKNLPFISLQAHLLWILSWCFSDDEGVIENDPLLLKSQIFPRRTDIRIEQIQQWIDQLIKARYLIPFTHNSEGYLLHRTFKVHQKIDRPQPSKIPSDVIRRLLDDCSMNIRLCIVEDSNVKESNVEPPPVAATTDYKREKLNEFFFRVAPHLKQNIISDEVSKFLNKYPDVPANKCGALVNKWVANLNNATKSNSAGNSAPALNYDRP